MMMAMVMMAMKFISTTHQFGGFVTPKSNAPQKPRDAQKAKVDKVSFPFTSTARFKDVALIRCDEQK